MNLRRFFNWFGLSWVALVVAGNLAYIVWTLYLHAAGSASILENAYDPTKLGNLLDQGILLSPAIIAFSVGRRMKAKK